MLGVKLEFGLYKGSLCMATLCHTLSRLGYGLIHNTFLTPSGTVVSTLIYLTYIFIEFPCGIWIILHTCFVSVVKGGRMLSAKRENRENKVPQVPEPIKGQQYANK